MAQYTQVNVKTCTGCKESYPRTRQFFYSSGRTTKDGNVVLKAICKFCTQKLRASERAVRKQHPTHRGDNEDANGFVWGKTTQAKFRIISKMLQERNLTPAEVLGMSPKTAADVSYVLGTKLKVVKYAIRTQHQEAMLTLFPPVVTLPEPEPELIPEPESEVLTLKIAAERLLTIEARLDAANIDLVTARNMYNEAVEKVTAVKAERREAVKFLADMAQELMRKDDSE